MRDILVAGVIMQSYVGKVDLNLKKMEIFVNKAKSRGVEIICFPEACITGYDINPSIHEHAIKIPGREIESVQKMAKDKGIFILAGMIEKGFRGSIFISHVIVHPDGEIDLYRKIHLSPPEMRIFEPGNQIHVFNASGITLGIGLCYEGHFPELFTIMALKGADVIFVPHASPRGSPKQKLSRWLRYLPARSYDNGVFLVACNQTGRHPGGLSFPGVGIIIDPKGRILTRRAGWKEGMITAWLRDDLMKKVKGNPMAYFLTKRRPEVYQFLVNK